MQFSCHSNRIPCNQLNIFSIFDKSFHVPYDKIDINCQVITATSVNLWLRIARLISLHKTPAGFYSRPFACCQAIFLSHSSCPEGRHELWDSLLRTNFTNRRYVHYVYQDTSVSVGRWSGYQAIRFNLIFRGLISFLLILWCADALLESICIIPHPSRQKNQSLSGYSNNSCQSIGLWFRVGDWRVGDGFAGSTARSSNYLHNQELLSPLKQNRYSNEWPGVSKVSARILLTARTLSTRFTTQSIALWSLR